MDSRTLGGRKMRMKGGLRPGQVGKGRRVIEAKIEDKDVEMAVRNLPFNS